MFTYVYFLILQSQVDFICLRCNYFYMVNDKKLPIEFKDNIRSIITFRMDPKDKELYEELRVIHKVKNLPKLCRDAITEIIHKVARQVDDKAG